jgi:hypothetical protein
MYFGRGPEANRRLIQTLAANGFEQQGAELLEASVAAYPDDPSLREMYLAYQRRTKSRRVRSNGSGSRRRLFPNGTHEFDWDLRETGGTRVGSGLYFVRLTAASGERRGRMVVVQ